MTIPSLPQLWTGASTPVLYKWEAGIGWNLSAALLHLLHVYFAIPFLVQVSGLRIETSWSYVWFPSSHAVSARFSFTVTVQATLMPFAVVAVMTVVPAFTAVIV